MCAIRFILLLLKIQCSEKVIALKNFKKYQSSTTLQIIGRILDSNKRGKNRQLPPFINRKTLKNSILMSGEFEIEEERITVTRAIMEDFILLQRSGSLGQFSSRSLGSEESPKNESLTDIDPSINKPPQKKIINYQVEPNDTLQGLSLLFKTSPTEIMQLNNMLSDRLNAYDILRLAVEEEDELKIKKKSFGKTNEILKAGALSVLKILYPILSEKDLNVYLTERNFDLRACVKFIDNELLINSKARKSEGFRLQTATKRERCFPYLYKFRSSTNSLSRKASTSSTSSKTSSVTTSTPLAS